MLNYESSRRSRNPGFASSNGLPMHRCVMLVNVAVYEADTARIKFLLEVFHLVYTSKDILGHMERHSLAGLNYQSFIPD